MSARTDLQLLGLFKLLPIALTLPCASRREEDVFRIPIDVLLPVRQPGDSVVMHDLFPRSRDVGYGHRSRLGDVDNDIFGV